MLNELKKYFSYLFIKEEGRGTKNKIIFILLVVLSLILLNRLFLFKFANKEYFQTYSALSNLVFLKGISPYSRDISSILVNYFSSRGTFLNSNTVIFQLPIYQLIFYLPFSFISNFDWSLSLWMTANQCLYLLCITNCLKIFNWEPKGLSKLIILGVGLFTYFGISNYLAANTSIIQLLFLILGIKALFNEKYISAGLLLGIATIDPFSFFIPLIIVIAFLIIRRQIEPLLWTFISIVLLSLGGIIFDSGWILKFLRNIFLEGSFFPFIDYNHALLNWLTKLSSSEIVNFVPIILMIWLYLEFSRLPKQGSNHLFWMLSLTACINPFIIMREINYSSVLYLLPVLFIVYLWENHSSGLLNKVIYGILGFIVVALPLAASLFPGQFTFISSFHTINLINSLVMIIILYWIRWWVVIPYDYLTNK